MTLTTAQLLKENRGRFLLIGLILAAIAGAFAYVGGFLTPRFAEAAGDPFANDAATVPVKSMALFTANSAAQRRGI